MQLDRLLGRPSCDKAMCFNNRAVRRSPHSTSGTRPGGSWRWRQTRMGVSSSAPHSPRTSRSPVTRSARIFGSSAVAIHRLVSGRNAVTMAAFATPPRASSGSGTRGITDAGQAPRPRPTRRDVRRASAESIGDFKQGKNLFFTHVFYPDADCFFYPKGFWHHRVLSGSFQFCRSVF